MSNRSFIDQHENALITVYKVNSNGSYTNLSGVPQIEPEGIDVEEGEVLFLNVLYTFHPKRGTNTPFGDVNIQWSYAGGAICGYSC